MIFIIVVFAALLVFMYVTTDESDLKPKRTHAEVYETAPANIQCRCMECNEIVMVPKQYLQDLTYRGPQTAKCPNCDWKWRKVRIIQTWGLD